MGVCLCYHKDSQISKNASVQVENLPETDNLVFSIPNEKKYSNSAYNREFNSSSNYNENSNAFNFTFGNAQQKILITELKKSNQSKFINELIIIQKSFRKFISKKKLKELFFEKLKDISKNYDIIMQEMSPIKFFRIKIDDKIKEILSYLDIRLIDSKRKISFEEFILKFQNFPKEKIMEKINNSNIDSNSNSNSIRLKINPIIRSLSDSTDINESYWGEWNLFYQKHGFGLKIVSKDKFYLGTFIKDEIEGFGILVYNIKENFEKNNKNNNLNNNNFNYNKINSNLNYNIFNNNNKEDIYNIINNINNKVNSINNSFSENNFIEKKFSTFRIIDSKSIDGNNSKLQRSSFSSNGSNSFFEELNIKFAIYIGEFLNGETCGKGELFLPNGEYYKGEFKNNKCNGIGEYYFQNNTTYKGEFINNKIAEKGKYKYINEEFKKFRLKEKFIKLGN
jgi:hypothetical protein